MENGLQWHNVIGICIDGARSMLGKYNGLQSLICEFVPLAKWTHCVLHREALAYQCFSIKLNQVFGRDCKGDQLRKSKQDQKLYF